MKKQYTVTLILPKDMTLLRKKYSEALADAVADMLTHEELGYLISEVKKKESVVQ